MQDHIDKNIPLISCNYIHRNTKQYAITYKSVRCPKNQNFTNLKYFRMTKLTKFNLKEQLFS